MAILMNYKRTVEDFGRCGSKAATVYGLPYVAECVGNSNSVKGKDLPESCPDMRFAVPCADGMCHSDYISCLRVGGIVCCFTFSSLIIPHCSWFIVHCSWFIYPDSD